MQETRFSRPAAEISCIIGNLFAEVQPPCEGIGAGGGIVIHGTTHAGSEGWLTIKSDCCVFRGNPEELQAVLEGRCPERTCENGR